MDIKLRKWEAGHYTSAVDMQLRTTARMLKDPNDGLELVEAEDSSSASDA